MLNKPENEMILMWLKSDINRQLETQPLSEEHAYLLSRAFDIISKSLKGDTK
jgi:hypothetical protein